MGLTTDTQRPGWWADFKPPGLGYVLSATTVRGNEVVIVTDYDIWHGKIGHDGQPTYHAIARL